MGAKVKEIKVETMAIIIDKAIMFEIETTNSSKTSTRVTIVRQIINVGSMFRLKMEKLLLGIMEVVWRELKICCEI